MIKTISPYNIVTESSRQVRRIKKKSQLGDYKLIQYQILKTEMIRILWQTLGRTTNEIFGVEGSRLREFTIIILEELKYRQVQQNFDNGKLSSCVTS